MTDRQAFLTAHGDAVWQIVCRLLDDDEDARECYQQTFLDALRIDDTVVQDWRGILCRIATRRAMDVLRKRYRERSKFRALAVDPSYETPPDADLLLQDLRQAVRETLATLPALQAEAFWLRHLEQMTVEEIGQQLKIEPGHVRVLVHRAAAHLRQTLSSTYGDVVSVGAEK